jgi:hypothetical protein
MPRVSITSDAHDELCGRIERLGCPDGGLLIARGPANADLTRASTGEAVWSIGENATWSALVCPLDAFAAELTAMPHIFQVVEVRGVKVGILGSERSSSFEIELSNGALSVRKVDA